jgi:hypothetical protein
MTNDNILIDKSQETIETWAYVEIMGHNKVAGRVSERKVGVAVMLQIDVPNPEDGFSHSVLYSPASIFSIQPTTEDWCRKFIAARVEYSVLPYIPQTRQLASGDDDFPNED